MGPGGEGWGPAFPFGGTSEQPRGRLDYVVSAMGQRDAPRTQALDLCASPALKATCERRERHLAERVDVVDPN